MNRNPAIKFIAFLLLLVFIQKMGAGLYLHKWLHIQQCEKPSSAPVNEKAITYSCSCIDEFSMPFLDLGIEIVNPDEALICPVSHAAFAEEIAVAPFLYNFLRGPPIL